MEVGVSVWMGCVEALACRCADGRADVWVCGWACRRVGVWMLMAVNKKGKTKEEKEKRKKH